MKKLKLALSVLSMFIVSSAVMAAPKQKVSGVYFGGSTGFSKATTINSEKNKDGEYDKYSQPSESSFQILGGYQFNRIVGIEMDYLDYGDSSSGLSAKSFSAQVNLGYTFQMGLRPFVLWGLNSVNLDQEINTYKDDTYLGVRLGNGLEYAPASIGGWAIRIAYTIDLFKPESVLNKKHVNYFANMSLGLNYKF